MQDWGGSFSLLATYGLGCRNLISFGPRGNTINRLYIITSKSQISGMKNTFFKSFSLERQSYVFNILGFAWDLWAQWHLCCAPNKNMYNLYDICKLIYHICTYMQYPYSLYAMHFMRNISYSSYVYIWNIIHM